MLKDNKKETDKETVLLVNISTKQEFEKKRINLETTIGVLLHRLRLHGPISKLRIEKCKKSEEIKRQKEKPPKNIGTPP